MEKEVEIQIDGKPVKFVLRTLKTQQKYECLRRASQVHVNRLGEPDVKIDPFLLRELRLAAAVIAPAEYSGDVALPHKRYMGDLEKLRELPEGIDDLLYAEFESMNKTGPLPKDESLPA